MDEFDCLASPAWAKKVKWCAGKFSSNPVDLTEVVWCDSNLLKEVFLLQKDLLLCVSLWGSHAVKATSFGLENVLDHAARDHVSSFCKSSLFTTIQPPP